MLGTHFNQNWGILVLQTGVKTLCRVLCVRVSFFIKICLRGILIAHCSSIEFFRSITLLHSYLLTYTWQRIFSWPPKKIPPRKEMWAGWTLSFNLVGGQFKIASKLFTVSENKFPVQAIKNEFWNFCHCDGGILLKPSLWLYIATRKVS